ncbi:ASNSD1 upstream open reading frame protein-like [Strongylocentrotus purpuratus]|uniref:Uncharacterized protein n=1 Tax=Strongylocentrotus purpuratus TaxID=7668 RepID=A0A7M7P3Z6_STRPU|nr:ASNSD1 upstream open reading frame protein-like [Strongylocentrotus purpuratus]
MAAPMVNVGVADAANIHANRQISELRVLQSELSSLKKNAKVYKQQQNSQVFFLTDKAHCQSQCKNQIETLEKMKKKKEQHSS